MADTSDAFVTVEESGEGAFANIVRTGRHELLADEPEKLGGTDTGPTPYDYLLAGLGACTAMTIRLYADRKEWQLTRVRVHLSHKRVHAEDCADCETEEGFVDEIERRIELEGDLSDDARRRILEIADKCPVHKTLTTETKIRTALDQAA